MCGIAVIYGKSAGTKASAFAHMMAAVQHRGQESRTFEKEDLLMGVSRLKIVDRDRAIQPFLDLSEESVIGFNGEIFNFRTIKSTLEANYKFKTDSDTETVLYAFKERGANCLEQLEGQFAFVIADMKNGLFFCARDRIGIKPLYFVKAEGLIYIASEIKALTFLGEQIHVLEPGHFMDQTGAPQRYFNLREISSVSSTDSVPALRLSLVKAIQQQVDTDLPLGVIYSGGLDSSIVLNEVAKHHSSVTAFTIGDERSEDFEVSKRFCKDRGIRHVLVPLSPSAFGHREVRKAIQIAELTEYGDIINAVITVELFRNISSQGIKIVLTGDGSDELFAGYSMYNQQGSKQDLRNLFIHKLTNLHRTELQRVDRCSMAFGVEARVPFLATEVLSIALTMSPDLKIKNGVEKWCLREAFKSDLPDYILTRKKNPMSHSSGLHEALRRHKLFFSRFYNAERFGLHAQIREDFSHTLKRNGYQIAKALDEAKNTKDYGIPYLAMEYLKATLRLTLKNFSF